jgi:hypothetical protein
MLNAVIPGIVAVKSGFNAFTWPVSVITDKII